MKILTGYTNRLGNRASNQDRCLVVEHRGWALLAVADGMGGHARGELAAETAVNSLRHRLLEQRDPIDDPPRFLEQALHLAHLEVIDAGRAQQPAVTPRTTCVVCLLRDNTAWWAHLGDSRLYHLRLGKLLTRTRDHSPVEELLQRGIIGEAEIRSHPLRNSVSRCLGGTPALPKVSLDQASLRPDDMLLLCSDGLWSALPEERLWRLPTHGDLGQALNRLADEAELASYPGTDNISLVGLRWLSGNGNGDQTAADPEADGSPEPAPGSVQTEAPDTLQQAIDAIHRAMLDYAGEMKK
jgi:serine/threonine protein phosphatase PrpC